MPFRRSRLLLYCLLLPTLLACDLARSNRITVFAAASLADVLPRIAASYTGNRGGTLPRFSFAASSVLARQIERGAPADLYVSAHPRWTEYLSRRGALRDAGRMLLTNRLVLVAREGRANPSDPALFSRMRRDFNSGGFDGRWALGDPAHVPAGIYAKAALVRLGWWSRLEGRIVAAADVRGALRFVARGECDYSIVYASDVHGEIPGVRTIALLPEDLHPPIRYRVARVNGADPGAADFFDFLFAPEAAAIFREYGFEPAHVSRPLHADLP